MPEIVIKRVAEIQITVRIVAEAATRTPTGRLTTLEETEILEIIAEVTVDVVAVVVAVVDTALAAARLIPCPILELLPQISKIWPYLRSYKSAKDSPQTVTAEIQVSGSLIVVRLTT
ncbi:hypothetical protein HDU96_001539 [Phlyctochytrium bullatum]|nr:hypothetical protein HDU96_001539 [Phlyctochytrium bullatum]